MLIGSKPYTFDTVVRIGIGAAILFGLVRLLGHLSDVLIPFVVAFLLAYLINPLVQWFQRRIPSRAASILISLAVIAAVIVILAWMIFPMIAQEIGRMGRLLGELVNNTELAERAAARIPPDLWDTVKEYASRKEIQDFFRADNFWKIAETVLRKVLPGVWGIITGTASFLLGLVGLTVIGLYLIFLLLDYDAFTQGWKNLIPPAYSDAVTSFVKDFDSAMNRYFRAQAAVASIVGVLFAVGFTLIGLPLGILLGLLIGLLNMVPYLQILGLIPAFLLAMAHALETGSSFLMVLGLTGSVFIVVQLIQDAVLVPKIMGDVTGLSPAMILLSLSVWGKLLGLFGLLIALPMTCLLLAYYRRFLVSAGTNNTIRPLPDETPS